MANPRVREDLLIKVDRAYKHIIEFNAETMRFLGQGGPYKIVHEDDLNAGERTYYLSVLKEIPPQFSALVGDIVQNLRSSLDHLAWHLVHSSPVTPKAKDIEIYFPIFETASEYRAGKMRKIKGMTDAAIDAIDRIEPYYHLDGPGVGQGLFLYWLHEVNRLDKHRLLVPVWANMVSHTIPKTKLKEMPEGLRAAFQEGEIFLAASAITPGPLKDGSKLLTIPIAEVDDDMKFNFHIAFGEPACVRLKEIHTTLAVWHKRIQDIIVGFDNQGLL